VAYGGVLLFLDHWLNIVEIKQYMDAKYRKSGSEIGGRW
jgi:hypothetical protein